MYFKCFQKINAVFNAFMKACDLFMKTLLTSFVSDDKKKSFYELKMVYTFEDKYKAFLI